MNDTKNKIKKVYRSPKPKDKKFNYYWDLFVDAVTSKENFIPAHLEQLKILCKLYTEVDLFNEMLIEEGYVFESNGRYGIQKRPSPYINLKLKAVQEIRAYSKVLGITISKELAETDDDDSWS